MDSKPGGGNLGVDRRHSHTRAAGAADSRRGSREAEAGEAAGVVRSSSQSRGPLPNGGRGRRAAGWAWNIKTQSAFPARPCAAPAAPLPPPSLPLAPWLRNGKSQLQKGTRESPNVYGSHTTKEKINHFPPKREEPHVEFRKAD